MNRRTILTVLAAGAALTALWFLWPTLSRSGRPEHTPRIDGWAPTHDPGTVLVVVTAGRRVLFGLGADHHCVDATCVAPLGCEQVEAAVYRERDGVLGRDGEPPDASFENRPAVPQTTQSFAGHIGYVGGRSLAGSVRFSDGSVSSAIVGAPVQFVPGLETPWQMLTAVPSLGVLIEWSQTKDHLLIRRSALPGSPPGAPPPTWGFSSFQVLDASCQFADDTQVARLFRARVARLGRTERNVQVEVLQDDEGIILTRITIQ